MPLSTLEGAILWQSCRFWGCYGHGKMTQKMLGKCIPQSKSSWVLLKGRHDIVSLRQNKCCSLNDCNAHNFDFSHVNVSSLGPPHLSVSHAVHLYDMHIYLCIYIYIFCVQPSHKLRQFPPSRPTSPLRSFAFRRPFRS